MVNKFPLKFNIWFLEPIMSEYRYLKSSRSAPLAVFNASRGRFVPYRYKNHINLLLSRPYYLMMRHFAVICNIYGGNRRGDTFRDKSFDAGVEVIIVRVSEFFLMRLFYAVTGGFSPFFWNFFTTKK